MKFEELNEYLTNNYVFGFTVKIKDNELVYSYLMMFRKNKQDPEKIYISVSTKTKRVLGAWTDKGYIFKNINELKFYTKKK